MLGTVREQVVDNHADNWEEEDDQAPQKLGRRWAVGLEDLDCFGGGGHELVCVCGTERRAAAWALWALTEYNDIQDQDDESQYTAAGAVLPAVVEGRHRDVLRHWSGKGESGQAQLEQDGEQSLEHLDGWLRFLFCLYLDFGYVEEVGYRDKCSGMAKRVDER